MNASEFPISLWPGVPIDPPPVARGQATATWDGYLVWAPWTGEQPGDADSVSGPYRRVGNTARWEGGRLDPEVAIRELRLLDTDDQGQVIAFVNRYGRITDAHSAVDDVVAAKRGNGDASNHWQDVAMYLLDAQRLANHFVAFHDDDHLDAAWGFVGRVQSELRDDGGHWATFVELLNVGLTSVPPHAEFISVWDTGQHHALHGSQRPVNLYSALCIQLYNLILEGGELKTCANETCRFGGRFINQRGTAKHGQHRSIGVKYCTNACARIQGTRDNRRRKRAEAKGEQ